MAIALLVFFFSFLFSIAGLGSASATIPLLTIFGVDYAVARSTALFINFIATIFIAIYLIRMKKKELPSFLPILMGLVIFAPVGAKVSFFIPEKFLALFFTFFLILSFVIVTFIKRKRYVEKLSLSKSIFVGIFSGFFSGLLGVGGGSVITPLLLLMRLDPKKVVDISMICIPFGSMMGFLSYYFAGKVDVLLLKKVVIAAFLGGKLGRKVSENLDKEMIRKILSFILLGLAIKMSLKFL